MKTDLEFRKMLATSLVARLEVLGVAPSTFERVEGLAHNTFKNV